MKPAMQVVLLHRCTLLAGSNEVEVEVYSDEEDDISDIEQIW